MEAINEYLSSATIHGFNYIGSTKSRILKLFWIIIVVVSFIISLNMILASFSSWKKSPIISTIETKPISAAKFTKVIVCPPEGSNTVLNYDIAKVANQTLGTKMKNILHNHTEEFVLKESY